jgi:protease IV
MKKKSVFMLIAIFCVVAFIGFILFLVALGAMGSNMSTQPIAVVKIEGPIFESLPILKELEELKNDYRVKAVVLRLNSPGGAVAPSQEIMAHVLKLKKHKKVIVSMGTVAASGAYYIASAADKIVASSGTITGSIGVILETFGLQKLAQKLEVEPRVVKSGKFKDVGNPFKTLSDSDRQYLQNITDDMYNQFVSSVAENRGLPIEKVKVLAQGIIYTGLQAKNVGLVDELGNIYDAIDLAKKEAGLPANTKVKWPKEPTGLEKFFGHEARSVLSSLLQVDFGMKFIPMWLLRM